MNNNINKSLILILMVIVMLAVISLLPTFTVFGVEVKKVDLLADVKAYVNSTELEPQKSVNVDQVKKIQEIKKVELKCPEGKTCIEDYSGSKKEGMAHFYKALDRSKKKGNYIRIAMFGDSFIEGDIFSADLRELLQQKFGGRGVGFVSMTSAVSGFRRTVRHTFGGWSSYLQQKDKGFVKEEQGVDGKYFKSTSDSFVELRGQSKHGQFLDVCQVSSIYFTPKANFTVTATVNKEEKEVFDVDDTGKLEVLTVKGDNITSVKWAVEGGNPSPFYGVTMEGENGVVLDNFSSRGSTGLSLSTIPVEKLKQFNKVRPYDLIILEYGLNVVEKKRTNYTSYTKALKKTIQNLKTAFPKASILLLSVADRDYKGAEGKIVTMPGVYHLVESQQLLAIEEKIAFWNMFEAMGGEGSMLKLNKSKPSMANKDYTHINFAGGKFMGELLFEALIHGKKQYDRQRR